jgi:hypothetical protein
MATESIGISGILSRFGAALVLVLLTYNPSGWSYVHWAAREWASISPPLVLAGIALLIGWGIYVSATAQSLGMIGTVLFGALFAALVWTATFYGWLSLENRGSFVWVLLVIVAAILALGMSWSHLRKQMTGQAAVDEIERH